MVKEKKNIIEIINKKGLPSLWATSSPKGNDVANYKRENAQHIQQEINNTSVS